MTCRGGSWAGSTGQPIEFFFLTGGQPIELMSLGMGRRIEMRPSVEALSAREKQSSHGRQSGRVLELEKADAVLGLGRPGVEIRS